MKSNYCVQVLKEADIDSGLTSYSIEMNRTYELVNYMYNYCAYGDIDDWSASFRTIIGKWFRTAPSSSTAVLMCRRGL